LVRVLTLLFKQDEKRQLTAAPGRPQSPHSPSLPSTPGTPCMIGRYIFSSIVFKKALLQKKYFVFCNTEQANTKHS